MSSVGKEGGGEVTLDIFFVSELKIFQLKHNNMLNDVQGYLKIIVWNL